MKWGEQGLVLDPWVLRGDLPRENLDQGGCNSIIRIPGEGYERLEADGFGFE
jgi:hypothetical protein